MSSDGENSPVVITRSFEGVLHYANFRFYFFGLSKRKGVRVSVYRTYLYDGLIFFYPEDQPPMKVLATEEYELHDNSEDHLLKSMGLPIEFGKQTKSNESSVSITFSKIESYKDSNSNDYVQQDFEYKSSYRCNRSLTYSVKNLTSESADSQDHVEKQNTVMDQSQEKPASTLSLEAVMVDLDALKEQVSLSDKNQPESSHCSSEEVIEVANSIPLNDSTLEKDCEPEFTKDLLLEEDTEISNTNHSNVEEEYLKLNVDEMIKCYSGNWREFWTEYGQSISWKDWLTYFPNENNPDLFDLEILEDWYRHFENSEYYYEQVFYNIKSQTDSETQDSTDDDENDNMDFECSSLTNSVKSTRKKKKKKKQPKNPVTLKKNADQIKETHLRVKSVMNAMRLIWDSEKLDDRQIYSSHIKVVNSTLKNKSQNYKKRLKNQNHIIFDSESDSAPENENASCENLPSESYEPAPRAEIPDISMIECATFESHPSIEKYWCQRYRLFSKFDDGIKMDVDGWFSATPEKIAIHLAERCKSDVIIDAMAGVGGNVIHFAKIAQLVIAIDIDPNKIAIARHNAAVYGVADKIQFIVGDFMTVSKSFRGLSNCAVFLSPPWGGPCYSEESVFDPEFMFPGMKGSDLFAAARNISTSIAIYLPRNVDVARLVGYGEPGGVVEVEQNYLNRKLKTITAYYGELCRMSQSQS